MPNIATCYCCDSEMGVAFGAEDGVYESICEDCQRVLPPSLIKACSDPFDYALCLKNGLVIHFHQAERRGEWITLHAFDDDTGFDKPIAGFPFPRGIDIRISEIVWCGDAPQGS